MTFRPITLALLASLLFASSINAQTRGTGFLPPAAPSVPAARTFRQAGVRYLPAHRPHRRYFGYGPYFYPSYPYDYDDGSAPPPPPPQRFQPEQSEAAVPSSASAKPAESMVVELRGDRWVRLTSSGPQEVAPAPQAITAATVSSTKPLSAFSQPAPAAALPPATLVFRDGHQEQAAKYTIVGSTLYLKSDYWSTGSWLRKIPLSDLDIPTTMKLNRERGSSFSLPSRPSEIILRP
jgi:hypothetical protein